MKTKIIKPIRVWLLLMVFTLAVVLRIEAQAPPQFFTIHHFNGSAGDGVSPIGNMVEDPDGNIFGVTQNGGMNNSNNGTFFVFWPAGGPSYNYTNLYNFTGGTDDGGHPVGDLTIQINGQTGNLAGNSGKLTTKVNPKDDENFSSYEVIGECEDGGADGDGTVDEENVESNPAVNKNSGFLGFLSVFEAIASKPNPADPTQYLAQAEGKIAKPAVVASGNMLYGVNVDIVSDGGEVFSLNTNGTGYTVLHNFGGQPDGIIPNYSLTLSGNTLYGTTREDGSNRGGTVWKVNTDGSGYAILHSFTNAPGNSPDGKTPLGGVVISGNTLYGTTSVGGDYDGTVFKMNTNGSNFQVIGIFGDDIDCGHPKGDLIMSGNTLYGTASAGGANGGGSVFSINTDGGNFTELYGFSYPNSIGGGVFTNSDGCYPTGGLLLSGNTLFGSTPSGGIYGGGTVFGLLLAPLVITASPTNGTVPLAVQFNAPINDYFGNPLTNWNWYFGDGSTSTEQNPSHSYTTPGNYTSSLVATNNNGVSTSGIGPTITVTPPSVQFTASPTNGMTPLSVQFNSLAIDSRSNTITNWNWNFGDGSTSTQQNPTHIYANAGYFSPSLIATNDLGGTVLGYGPSINAVFNSGLVLNGGFETGDFTGWTLSADSYNFFADNGYYSGITPHSGTYEAALLTSGSLGYLSQTIPTTAGTSYLLSFWLNNSYHDSGEFLVSWNGNMLLDETNPVAPGWTNIQFTVTATGASTVLQFGFQDDYDNFGFDDVSITPMTLAPVPFGNIRLSGNEVILNWTNPAFALQAAPNVTGTYTNIPGATSPYTNPVTSGQKFFRLIH